MPKIPWTDRTDNTTPSGATTEAQASTYNTLKQAINSPSEGLGTFIPAAITFDKTGWYSDYNAITNISLTLTGTHYEGVVLAVKILFDGSVTLTVPSGGIILNTSFTSGAIVPAGTYYLFMLYQNGIPLYQLSTAIASGSIPQLTAPSISSIVANSTTQITVTFTDPNTSPNEAYPQIQYDTVNTFDSSPVTTSGAQDDTTKIISGLDLINNQYYVRVRAFGDGVTATNSNWSGTGTAPKFPTMVSFVMSSDNTYGDLTFSEGVWGSDVAAIPIDVNDLVATFSNGGTGTAAGWTKTSVKQNDSAVEGSATNLVGGETVVRVFGTLGGTANGDETVTMSPSGPSDIFDDSGNAMDAAQSAADNLNTISIILMQDNFTGTTIDTTTKWDVTAGTWVTFTQNNNLIVTGDNGVGHLTAWQDVNIKAKTGFAITTGSIQADLTSTGVGAGPTQFFGLHNDDDNRISIFKNSASNPGFVIRLGAVNIYTLSDIGISMDNTFKIEHDSTANTVKLFYWNTSVWTQLGTTQSVDFGSLTFRAWATSSTIVATEVDSILTLDNFYLTNDFYTTQFPT